MANWLKIRRVIIITDTVLESAILKHVIGLGARGYTCVHCVGKGRHITTPDPLEDPFSVRSRVRIEILTKDESVAEAIMDYVNEPEFASYPITAFSDHVEVDDRHQGSF